MYSIRIDAADMINRLGSAQTRFPTNVKAGLSEIGEQVLSDAQRNVHKITGNLMRSGRMNVVSDFEVIVGFGMSYALVEENRVGGKYPGSHAYLGPAVERVRGKAQSIMTDAMRKSI